MSTLLILGASGTLGQALLAEGRARGLSMAGAARKGADLALDMTRDADLQAVLHHSSAEVVINAAASTDLEACERDPCMAYAINARAVALVARTCQEQGRQLIQVSTDHYFVDQGATPHDEQASVSLVNEYARSKFAGEALALTAPGALVVRTNVTGWRGWAGKPTFIEWAVQSLEAGIPLNLFHDYYTSTLHASALARGILDLWQRKATGMIHLASRQVSSKQEFILALARRMGIPRVNHTPGSVRLLSTPRAESCGLNVALAESVLGYALPTLDEVVDALIAERPHAL
ncbi:MAG: sugar nucleotide-binding protein [Magnetococcales bacterium]|nr:sugar nucleotide-binding protein [Magnetococcales bacterium]